ncbi:transposase [Streptomyces sp. NRRL S-118]|uniref:transposase n=1 Tax=Streptomyces sp. NRRL S-118 TaxID=1463881 RepID=UPI00099D3584
MARGDLTDGQWEHREPLLPVEKQPGRPRTWTHRKLNDGIRCRTRAGAPWRNLPERYGPWDRACDMFRRGSAAAPGAGSSSRDRAGRSHPRVAATSRAAATTTGWRAVAHRSTGPGRPSSDVAARASARSAELRCGDRC